MLKVAILGCGKIADAHASQIRRIAGCEIVGVCDREPLMAEQLRQRFPIGAAFADAGEMIAAVRPDVVHITTPPESHFDLAALCLERGCHVYVEKPFTLRAADTATLIAAANRRGLKLTAGHDDQFSHAARRLRHAVQAGHLGGRPVHMESTYCYDLSDGYARALLGDRHHWVRKLPGKLLHNIISHGIARIAEFLAGDRPQVIAHGLVSARLQNLGERELVDELRVIVTDELGTTAYFTFSSQMRPGIHEFRVYGPRHGLLLNQDHETLIALGGARLKSYADKFVPPLTLAGQYLGNFAANLKTFLAADFHMKSGMKYLIESFYNSIRGDSPVPIPYREILLTARIMDDIFGQLEMQTARVENIRELAVSR